MLAGQASMSSGSVALADTNIIRQRYGSASVGWDNTAAAYAQKVRHPTCKHAYAWNTQSLARLAAKGQGRLVRSTWLRVDPYLHVQAQSFPVQWSAVAPLPRQKRLSLPSQRAPPSWHNVR